MTRARRRACTPEGTGPGSAAALRTGRHLSAGDPVRQATGVFGLVNTAPGTAVPHEIIASGNELLRQVFGDAGRCTVSCIAATSLPFEIAVEMDAVFEIA